MTNDTSRNQPARSREGIHAGLGKVAGQPWREPPAGLGDRIVAAIASEAGRNHDASRADAASPRPFVKRHLLACIAALLLASASLLLALRATEVVPLPPSSLLSGVLSEISSGASLPEQALANEWAAITNDAAAAVETLAAYLPR